MKRSLARLPLWQAGLWVVLGGAAAHLAGAFTVAAMQSRLGLSPGTPAAARADLIVPALVASSGSLFLVAALVPVVAGKRFAAALNLRPASPLCFLGAAVGTVMLGPLADQCMRAMEALLPQLNLGVVSLLHELVRQVPVQVAWPAFALLPGLAEEFMFRGVLQSAAGTSTARAIVISATSFAFFHLDPHHIAGVLPLGFFLAWVAARCGTWVTIFAHVVNNSVAIAVVHSEAFDVGYGTNAPMPWPWLPASLALVAISGWIVLRNSSPPTGIIPVSDAEEL